MSSIAMIFSTSELALAAYANLTPGTTNDPVRRGIKGAGVNSFRIEITTCSSMYIYVFTFRALCARVHPLYI